MSDLRLVDCPKDRQTVADRVGPHAVRCRLCHVLICTCAGCGGMTLVANGVVLRCAPCGFERMGLPSDLHASPVRAVERSAKAPAASPRRAPADDFRSMPMPVFRRGAELPAPPMPRQRGVR